MSILGPIPEFPSNDWVSTFVEKCRHNDMISDTFGDEDTYYNPNKYFECTVDEISQNLGMSIDGVKSVLRRVRERFSIRLFIINYIDKMPDKKIIETIGSGKYQKINCTDFF